MHLPRSRHRVRPAPTTQPGWTRRSPDLDRSPCRSRCGTNVSLVSAKRYGEIPMAQDSLPGTTDRRLAGLLTLLAENATIVISGGRIAKEVGVSRSMVWRWVERLRELGVKVKGRPATGYFLEQVPDILTPNML